MFVMSIIIIISDIYINTQYTHSTLHSTSTMPDHSKTSLQCTSVLLYPPHGDTLPSLIYSTPSILIHYRQSPPCSTPVYLILYKYYIQCTTQCTTRVLPLHSTLPHAQQHQRSTPPTPILCVKSISSKGLSMDSGRTMEGLVVYYLYHNRWGWDRRVCIQVMEIVQWSDFEV